MRIRTKIFALVGGLGLVAGLVAGVAIDTVRTYDATVRAVDEGATRAHHSEHLNPAASTPPGTARTPSASRRG